jgi:hypothetical protein
MYPSKRTRQPVGKRRGRDWAAGAAKDDIRAPFTRSRHALDRTHNPAARHENAHVETRRRYEPLERDLQGLSERMMGLEPTTFCMASRRSSQLSYIREAGAV